MGTMHRACPAMPCPAPRGAPSVPAPLRLLALLLLCVLRVCLGTGWGGLAPDGANWDPHPHPSQTQLPSTPWPYRLLPLWLLLQGGCQADHSSPCPPPDPAQPGVLISRMGVSSPSPLQPALAAAGLWGARAAVTTTCHPWMGGGEAAGTDPDTQDHCMAGGAFPRPSPGCVPNSGRDAGLRVTLTLFPAGPGLGGSVCSLSVKGDPGKWLGSPRLKAPVTAPACGAGPHSPPQCRAALGERPQSPTKLGPGTADTAWLGRGPVGRLGLGGLWPSAGTGGWQAAGLCVCHGVERGPAPWMHSTGCQGW